jgi:hypothetical protein
MDPWVTDFTRSRLTSTDTSKLPRNTIRPRNSVSRASRLSDEDSLQTELTHLRNAFRKIFISPRISTKRFGAREDQGSQTTSKNLSAQHFYRRYKLLPSASAEFWRSTTFIYHCTAHRVFSDRSRTAWD